MPITPTNIKLICSDIDGTLLQYGKRRWKRKSSPKSKPSPPGASCSARRRGGSTPACANCLSR